MFQIYISSQGQMRLHSESNGPLGHIARRIADCWPKNGIEPKEYLIIREGSEVASLKREGQFVLFITPSNAESLPIH